MVAFVRYCGIAVGLGACLLGVALGGRNALARLGAQPVVAEVVAIEKTSRHRTSGREIRRTRRVEWWYPTLRVPLGASSALVEADTGFAPGSIGVGRAITVYARRNAAGDVTIHMPGFRRNWATPLILVGLGGGLAALAYFEPRLNARRRADR